MLGVVFLLLGFILFLAEAGYGVLRDRLSAARERSSKDAPWPRDGARELRSTGTFRQVRASG